MSLGKKKVRRSFSSVFKFSWNAATSSDSHVLGEDGVVRISFVLSNDSKQSEESEGRGRSLMDGVTDVANALAVVLEMNKSGASLRLKKSGDVSNALVGPMVLDETRLPRIPIADTGHWLLVEVPLFKVEFAFLFV